MKNASEQMQILQILYEIAMSIGSSLDLNQMLKASLSTLLKKLNCSAGGIHLIKEARGRVSFEQVYSIPRNTGRNETYQLALQNLPPILAKKELVNFFQRLPLSGQSDQGNYFHILELPDLGVLIVVKMGQDLDPLIVKSLHPLQKKLAEACKACLTKEALARSERRFRQVVSSISDHVYMTEFTGEGEQINRYIAPNAETLTGYPLEKFRNDWSFWPTTVIHPDDQALAAVQVERFAQGQNSEIEYRLVRANGNIIWVRDSGRVEKDEDQQRWTVYGVVSDITERKQVEQTLKESEKKFRTLAETIGSAIFIYSDQQCLYANPAAEEMTGYSRMELLKMDFWKLVHPDFQEMIKESDLISLHSKKSSSRYEIKFLQKDDQERWGELATRGIDFEGQSAELVTVFDVTKRKQAEEALSMAYQKAVEASRMKTDLLANVSHDLRTPLNAIFGYTEMMQEGVYGPLSGRQQEAIKKIIGSTGQLLNFVNNLLDQAQIDSGQVVLKTLPFAPADLVEGVTSIMGLLARTKGLKLISHIDPALPPTILGDPYWLRQILANLVSNAIKFTEKGQVHINLARLNEVYWSFEVSDTGPGIPPDVQAFIFEPYQQEDTFTSRGSGGSGLGLSIVKHLTELMGGKIDLNSEVGKGTTLTVALLLFSEEETNEE